MDGMPQASQGVGLALEDVPTSSAAIPALRGARLEPRAGGAHALPGENGVHSARPLDLISDLGDQLAAAGDEPTTTTNGAPQ